MTTLLREECGFDGFVVSDCGAVGDTYNSPMFNMATTGMKGDILFPFGHGLSYTSFDYSNIKVSKAELYASKCCGPNEVEKKPIRQLKAFQKIFLKAGETKTVALSVPLKEISFWSAFYKKMVVEEGEYRIVVR